MLIMKTFLTKDIKINHEYNLVENLPRKKNFIRAL